MIQVKAQYDGKSIRPLDPEALTEYKRTLTEGVLLCMSFEPWNERRTPSQQRLLHEMLGRLGREIGESLERVKVDLKIELGYYVPADKIINGTVPVPAWRGSFIDLHEHRPQYYPEHHIVFLRSEADYTRKMEAEFIERVMSECGEQGVDIRDIIKTLSEVSR